MIIDRASLTHNSSASIEFTLKNLHKTMSNGSYFIGIDWFSTAHSDFAEGAFVDEYTRGEITKGQFEGVGRVHFSDDQHLRAIFAQSGFSLELLEHKVVECKKPQTQHRFAAFNFLALRF